MPEPIPELVKVARDLREIEALSEQLPDEAAHKGADSAVMAMLGPVANLEAWQHRIDTAWERHLAECERESCRDCDVTPHVDDHDPEWEPPLQTLTFWSEQWRVQHNRESDRRPTVATEAAYLRSVLDWAWDHEPHWDDFAADVRKARLRVEDELRAGDRDERGVPCMYDECGGVRLRRTINQDGTRSDWYCPRKRDRHTWDEDAYARMVTAAHEATKFEVIDGETWCTVDYAARAVDRPSRTVQTWVNAGRVRKACLLIGRRRHYVSLEDVREEDARAGRRRRGAA